jgi:alanyl-tRNA synthetase
MDSKESQTPAASTSEPPQSTPPEKMVPESDVVKAKGGLQKQLEEAKSAIAEAHSLRLQAEAKVQTLEENQKKSADQLKELESLKTSMESMKKASDDATVQALQYRRALIAKEYNVPEDTIKAYGMQELEMFEKALKVVKSNTGGSQYAAGGGAGAPVAQSDTDRALRNLSKAQQGTPNTPTPK